MVTRKVRAGGILFLAGMVLAAGPTLLQGQEEGEGGEESGQCPLEAKEITRQARDRLVEAARLDTVSPEEAQGQYQQALTRLRLALKQDSADATAHLLASRAYIGLGQYADADSMLTRFTELLPQEPCRLLARRERQAAWAEAYNAGIRAYQAGEDSTAVSSFERANVIMEDPRSLNNAALLNQQTGDTERARQLYRRSMEIAEQAEQLRAAAINLAELMRNQGEADSALTIYTSYLDRHPDDVQATINYAVTLRTAGQQDSAGKVFQGLLQRDDLGFRQWVNVGIGLLESDAYQGAIRAFQQAREVRPYDKPSMENLVDANMGARNFGRAATLADSLVDWYPYQKTLYRSLMQALDRQGRTEAVQRILPQIQDMPLEFPRLNMVRRRGGGYVVRGQVTGRAMAGQQVTIPFEFFDAQGEVVASEEATLTLPSQGQTQAFQLQVQTDAEVAGFRYGEVGGGS